MRSEWEESSETAKRDRDFFGLGARPGKNTPTLHAGIDVKYQTLAEYWTKIDFWAYYF